MENVLFVGFCCKVDKLHLGMYNEQNKMLNLGYFWGF